MMRPRKLAVLAAAVISVPLSWTGIANAAEVNVCEIVARPASFDHKSIMLQGRAMAVKETTSRRGNDYTTFKLQGPNGCGGRRLVVGRRAIFSQGTVRRTPLAGRSSCLLRH
jgi:hypothetical protein